MFNKIECEKQNYKEVVHKKLLAGLINHRSTYSYCMIYPV